ncbi:MAG: 2-C-methyl-D-erythritol 2,4-cyclodiphosphate synthase [Clostridia bacterium]|nr:2-C-methyl-D-erythritol 2,4-cyclodiphosphate synthase [Clostridia bacterium]
MQNERIVGILLCAGSSQRMGFDKLMRPLAGKSAIERSMKALVDGGVTELIFVVSESTDRYVRALNCPVPSSVVGGGSTRSDSVRNALLSSDGDVAVIHDAARCLVSPDLVRSCIRSAAEFGSGVAAIPLTDTVFRKTDSCVSPVSREGLMRMQTPQAFHYESIRKAYAEQTVPATDDCSVFLQSGNTPCFVPGSEDNFKLTFPDDFTRAERRLLLYGTGFDTHRLVEKRKLILGGVEIPFDKGLLGHSDADALTHAVMDALLSAGGLPDIGHLFPDTDPEFEGADSIQLLKQVVSLLAAKKLHPRQISATIIAQRPKMAPYLPEMSRRLAEAAGIPPASVALGATTTEGMNDEGRGLCISVQAIASLC